MDVITTLFSQYSIESIIIFVLIIGLAIKFIGELIEYFYNKAKKYFNDKTSENIEHSQVLTQLSELKDEIKTAQNKIENLNNEIEEIKQQNAFIMEREQENTRSFIIDKHHYFVYEVKAIDDLNLQALERQYLYYKKFGGNTFIDTLMEEVRELPRINLQNVNLPEEE